MDKAMESSVRVGDQTLSEAMTTDHSNVLGNQANPDSRFPGKNRYIGGGRKKEKFQWNDDYDAILRDCAARAQDEEGPFKENLRKFFVEALSNLEVPEKFTGTAAALSARYSTLKKLETNPKPEKVNLEWTDEQCKILLECGLEAKAMKERNKFLSYSKILYDKFIARVPKYNGGEANLRMKFNNLSESSKESDIDQIQTEVEKKLTELDMSAVKDTMNLPKDMTRFIHLLKIGKEHGMKPLFIAMCYRCGKLLFGDSDRSGRWKLISMNKTDEIPVESVYGTERLPKTIPYLKGKQGYVCRPCQSNPNILEIVNLLNPVDNRMTIPPELSAITEVRDLNSISLLSVLYNSNVHRKGDHFHRIFAHVQGEVNLLSKHDQAYKDMFTLLCNQKQPSVSKGKELVKKALKWLREHNPLYKEFYANCETLYGHFEKPKAEEFESTKGEKLKDLLGTESIGMFLPANDYEGQDDIQESDFKEKVAHPKEPIDPNERHRRLTRPGIKNPNLEALGFPRDFPGGTGSWDPESEVKHSDWNKLLFLNWDDRFRRNVLLQFFSIDRYIKYSLMQVQRIVLCGQGAKAFEKPTVEDLKKNPYKRYGDKVPATIPGSKPYWWTRTQEVHAITQDIGRNPDYFITLTANDNWREIQRCVHHGPDNICPDDPCPYESEDYDEMGESATNFPTECSIAFHMRWQLFKKHILHNEKGELGKVEHYWFRREYQKRGAVHMHGVVWVDPSTKRQNVVRGEVPRGDRPNDPLEKELKALVVKYQTHKCRPDICFVKGNKKLNKCRFRFPQPISNEVRPDETGLRKYYIRRAKEDQYITSYSLEMLLLMRAHCNIQEISLNGWEMYLTKYMTKAEPITKVSIYGPQEEVTKVQRYLQMRCIGAVEANDILLQFPAVESSIDCEYLPIGLEADVKVLMREQHRPKDLNSTKIYYDSKLEVYLDRPKELAGLTYPDYFRFYKRGAKVNETEVAQSDGSEDESEGESEKSSAKPLIDRKNRKIFKRRNRIAVRFPFFLPYGDNQEKYCLKLLLLNNPYDNESIKSLKAIQKEGSNNSFLQECIEQKLWDDSKTSLAFLSEAEKKGFSEIRIREFAAQLVQFNYLCHAEATDFLKTYEDRQGGEFRDYTMVYNDDGEEADFIKECPISHLDLKPISFYEKSFNAEQRQIFDSIRDSLRTKKQIRSVVVGPAGSGKSHLLKAICALCKDGSEDGATRRSFGVLAPTGSAAHLIGGQTIHSMFRLDINLKSHIKSNSMEEQLIRFCDVWLIDEMSMIERDLFLTIHKILQKYASWGEGLKPFGGKNIIFFGDPAQLPSRNVPMFCSTLFQKCKIFTLKEIVRQEDMNFARILRDVRVAKVTPEVIGYFNKLVVKDKKIDYKEVIEKNIAIVVARCEERDRINNEILDLLEGDEQVFKAQDQSITGAELTEEQLERLNRCTEKFKGEVRIKKDALIVLRRNINTSSGLVNGRLGFVESFGENHVLCRSLDGKQRWPVHYTKQTLQDYGGEDCYVRHQIPIDLGWASTVHRVQGTTLNEVYVQLDESFFDSGMAYVALSRVRRPEHMKLLAFDHRKIMLSDFYVKLLEWIEKNDEFGANRDTTFPFPEWDEHRDFHKKHNEKPKTGKTPNLNKGIESDFEMSSQGSHMSVDQEVQLPNDMGEVMGSEPIEITDPPETMADKCQRLLEELLESDILYWPEDDFGELREYLDQHEDFIDEVLQLLLNQEQLLLNQLRNPVTEIVKSPIHLEMKANFRVVQISPDGNCFYHAISVMLFGNEDYMWLIRFAALVMLYRHRAYFQQWAAHDGTTLSDQMSAVARDTAFAENISELAVAIAIDKPIVLYFDGGHPVEILPSVAHEERITHEALTLRLAGQHFSAVVPVISNAIRRIADDYILGVAYQYVGNEMVPRYPL